MFAVTHEDIVAVRRAYMVGMDNALAECRRRWPALPDRALPGVLDRVMLMRTGDPPPFARRSEPHRDGPGIVRQKGRREDR